MITHHIQTVARNTFVRSSREAFGQNFPLRRFTVRRQSDGAYDPERTIVGPTVAVCAAVFFILVWSGAA